MSQVVIGLDLGTTNVKAVALDAHSHILGASSSSHSMTSPRPGWAVEDVREIWTGVLEALKAIAQLLPVKDVLGICLSGAMQSLLPLDDHLEPITLAMTWADNRSARQGKALRSHDRKELLFRVGCPLQHVYNPARIRWWIEEAPVTAAKTSYYVAIKDWITYQLCGTLATDYGLASTTGMLDIRRLDWDEEAISLAGITRDHLPALIAPEKVIGGLSVEVARLTGLPEGLPIIAGTSDGGLANLGTGAITPGQQIVTVGTSGAVRKIVDQPWIDPEGRTWCYVLMEGRWFAGGAINNGGLTLQWVREKFYSDMLGEEGYTRMLREAAEVAPGANGVMMLPYFTGERSPYWSPDATAVILGLGLQHRRCHIARAALEGVAYCLGTIYDILKSSANTEGNAVFLTGGINRNPLWATIIADVLGVNLCLVDVADASATGAAMIGQYALGQVSRVEEFSADDQSHHEIKYDPDRHEFYRNKHTTFQSLYRILENERWGETEKAIK